MKICPHLMPLTTIKFKGPYSGEASVRGYLCELIEKGERCDNYDSRASIPQLLSPLALCITGELVGVEEPKPEPKPSLKRVTDRMILDRLAQQIGFDSTGLTDEQLRKEIRLRC